MSNGSFETSLYQVCCELSLQLCVCVRARAHVHARKCICKKLILFPVMWKILCILW
jgi:hypothetical protein